MIRIKSEWYRIETNSSGVWFWNSNIYKDSFYFSFIDIFEILYYGAIHAYAMADTWQGTNIIHWLRGK